MNDDDLLNIIAEAVKNSDAAKAAIARFRVAAYNDGAEHMRDLILSAAAVKLPESGDHPQLSSPNSTGVSSVYLAHTADRNGRRAPRGSVGAAIDSVLRKKPGLPIVELETEVARLNPEVSIKSVGNELRRMEGRKYRRDRAGGYHWFLLDEQVGGATDAVTSAANALKMTGGSDDAAP